MANIFLQWVMPKCSVSLARARSLMASFTIEQGFAFVCPQGKPANIKFSWLCRPELDEQSGKQFVPLRCSSADHGLKKIANEKMITHLRDLRNKATKRLMSDAASSAAPQALMDEDPAERALKFSRTPADALTQKCKAENER
jgi:uncharacterized sporulation protein YeaH/YhbH (DUF444 family)